MGQTDGATAAGTKSNGQSTVTLDITGTAATSNDI